MRHPREVPSFEFDLLYPIDMAKAQANVAEDDCFGKEWNPGVKDCSVCADAEVCGIVFQKEVKKPKQQALEKKDGPYLDQARLMTGEEFKFVEDTIKQTCVDMEPTSTEEMFQYFAAKMKTKDEALVVNEMKRFIKSTPNVYTKNGLFFHKEIDMGDDIPF